MFISLFGKLFLWRTKSNNESRLPYCEITIHSEQNEDELTLWGLLDTGAQYLMLPSDVASIIGIDTSLLNTEIVYPAFGPARQVPWAWIDITIGGTKKNVLAFFDEFEPPLIGVETIKSTMGFAVGQSGWLHSPGRMRLAEASSPIAKGWVAALWTIFRR